MRSRRLAAYVLAVDVLALMALILLPARAIQGQWGTLLLLVVLAVVAGIRPVRIPGLRHEVTASHPFIFLALATVGPLAACLVALASVVGAAVGRGRKLPLTLHFVFNLGAVVLSTTAGVGALHVAGGRPGQAVTAMILPLAAATAAYFTVNSGLVASAIAIDKRKNAITVWRQSFLWMAAPFATGLSLAIAMLAAMEMGTLWILMLSLPPCWVLLLYYRAHANKSLARH